MTVIASSPVPAAHDQLAHTVIRASAGSGKTFQLTNRYLQLVAAKSEPAAIFASTFTRLAAGQIRDRILLRLANAAVDENHRRELAQHIAMPSLSRQAVIDLLASLTHRIHQLQVRTIDSFFASIVKSFAIELNVPLGAQIVDESQAIALRSDAIRLVFDENEPQRLVELLRWLTQGASDRAITRTIDRVVNDLYAIYREAPPQAWECVPHVDGRLPPAQLVAAIERLTNTPCTGSAQLVKTHRQDCENARSWIWPAFLAVGLAKPIARGQTIFNRQPIDPELVTAYMPLVRHAIAELVGRVREQTIATRELLSLFHAQYEKVKRRRRALTFDDLTQTVSQARRLGAYDDIGFRLDARIRHILLDEFQDTSIAQWRALEPIVSEIASVAPPERTFFCVGDVKQSIYGWRDAAPEVLEQLPQLFAGPDGSSAMNLRDLARSYRSSPIIIDVVNRTFQHLGGNPAVADYPDAVSLWSHGFVRHETEKVELPGYAELRLCRRAAEGQDAAKIRLREAAELAAQLHHRQPGISIAILTRTNDAVRRLLYELGPTRLNVPSSGRGGGPATDAAPVNVILDLLKLADHPDDTIAAFNVAGSPIGPLVGLDRHDNPHQRHAVGRDVRRRLVDHGYARCITDWVRRFASSCDARELRRLRQMIELADNHDRNPTLRTLDFIRIVEQTKIADAQPAPIQAMTVHQSKGLEFDAVILAELEGLLTGNTQPPVVFERHDEIGPISRISRYINEDVLDLVPELEPLFEQHRRRCVRESLSLLYVAMTRAIHALYLVLDPPELNMDGAVSRRNLKSLSGVVRHALAPNAIEPAQTHFTLGEPRWIDLFERKVQTAPAPPPNLDDLIALAPSNATASPRRGWSHAPASRPHAEHSLSRELRLHDPASRDRGIALHAMFEQIEWLDDFAMADSELARIAHIKTPRRPQSWIREQVSAFRRMRGNPRIREALSRASAQTNHAHLYREHPFARLIDGRLQTGFIDRLIVEDNDAGRPLAATIVDFKTDEVTDATGAAQCAERHRPQLEAYRAAVSALFKIDPAAVTMRLLFVEPGLVIDL